MKLKYTITLIFFAQLFLNNINAQCTVTASALPSQIVCGDCIELTAFGEAQGQSVFTESFNSGAPTGWQSTAQATYTNPCDPGGVDGTTHLWMGDATGVPRQMTTTAFDFSTATAGSTICFDMLFAEQGDASPCEGPDEPDEGVSLQYSIDNGASWVTIHYFDPNGGNDASLVNWNNWCFSLPPAALTANTQIRWFQDNDSGAEFDHWGLDNVNLYFNDPTYEITWDHDGYSYGVGSAGGTNPNRVCPQTTTTYSVTMTNGTTTCTDQVTIDVVQPTFRVVADSDTSICDGECVNLSGEAVVVKSPAKTPTYENNEFEAIQTGLGNTTDININITDLNMTNVLPGSITSVCINNLTFFGFNIFPPGQQTIGDLQVSLECPDGTEILLVPSGVTTNSSALNGYNSTCFTPVSTTDISTGTEPYTGDFMPEEPFDDLVGCSANGVWSLNIESTSALSFGTGTFFGWSISFDDPEISYTGEFTWSPTIDMTNETTLTPTVCPTATSTYTLTVEDTAGCASVSDDVTVTIDNSLCCNFDIAAAVMEPSCTGNDGAIDLTITNGSGNYSYSWTNGQGATEDITNVPAGTYTVTITDVDQGCFKDTTITLASSSAPVIDNIAETDANCGASDGSITITASGGTGTLQYSIDGGTLQTSNTFTNLAAGTYSIEVEDANGCSITGSATINETNAPVIDNIVVVDASCGASDGSITITASGGTGTLQYSLDGGTLQTSNSFTNLAAGTYSVEVEDANGCSVTSSETIGSSSGPTIDNIAEVDATCGNNNGSITITASGGTGTLEYSIDGGLNYQTSNTFTNLSAASYDVVVRDANACESSISPANITASNSPVIDNITVVDASCGGADGSITITASGGTGTLQYSIDGGALQTSNTFTNLPSGTYSIEVEDGNGCSVTDSDQVNEAGAPVIDNITVVDASCGASDGSLTVTASGGTGTLQYSINGGAFQTSNMFANLPSGTYSIEVEDANGCSVTSSEQINEAGAPIIDNIVVSDATCGNSNGSVTITASGGTGTLQYSLDGGAFQTSNSFTNLAFGTYSIEVEDANGCSVTSSATVGNSSVPVVDNVVVSNATCGNSDGSLTVVASGGTGTLQYSIDGGSLQVSNVFGNLPSGSYTVDVEDANGCSTSANVQVQNTLGVDSLLVTVTDVLCFGQTNGTIQLQAFNGVAPYTYFIFNNNDTTQNNSGSFTNLVAGDYAVWVEDANGCTFQQVVEIIEPQEIFLGDSVINPLCFGDANGQLILTASGGFVDANNPYTFTFNGETNTNGVFTNIREGVYTVSVEDNNNCSTSLQVTLEDADPVVIAVNPEDTTIILGDTFSIQTDIVSASGTNYIYEWSPQQGLSCTDCQNPIVDVYQDTEFQLNFFDENGCNATASLFVNVENPNQYFIPNAFTPSSFDATNNTFKVYGNHIKYIDMMVFNRWGEKIFESSSVDPEWDGTYKGKDQNPGVYTYYIEITFLNDDVVSEKGSITLLK